MDGASALFEVNSQQSSFRQGLNHFNDIFSKFTKYIAPSYHHDRPERSIHMRLYSMQKGQYLLLCIMFLCLFFIALLMGMAGPKITTLHETQVENIENPVAMTTPKLSFYRKELWFSVRMFLNDMEQKSTLSKEHNVTTEICGFVKANKCDHIFSKTNMYNLKCSEANCNPYILFHLSSIEFPRYLFNISFYSLQTSHVISISKVILTLTTYNPEFTKMEIWFRFFFVLTSLLATLLYAYTMQFYHFEDWSYEQKWLGILLPSLILYNNPIYAMGIVLHGIVSESGDIFFQWCFVGLLLLYWLCIFHGLRQIKKSFCSFYLPKLILVFTIVMMTLIIAIMEEKIILNDPSFTYEIATAHLKNVQRLFVLLLALYFVNLFYFGLRAFGELRFMSFIDSRLKFHAFSLLSSFSLCSTIMVNRYGKNILDDNIIARMYTSYESEHQFLALYTILNCYIYVLAYVYVPTYTQMKENTLLKDNPTFSMINESDDETEAMLSNKDPSGDNNSTVGNYRIPVMGHDDSD